MAANIASRLDFILSDVARLNGRRFDRLARERLGLSRAQCRLLGVLSMGAAEGPMNQAALADMMDMTPMSVAKLCARMQAGGWIEREISGSDRRANLVKLAPNAGKALNRALHIADQLQEESLAGFSAAERGQLLSLMSRLHANVSGNHGAGAIVDNDAGENAIAASQASRNASTDAGSTINPNGNKNSSGKGSQPGAAKASRLGKPATAAKSTSLKDPR